MLLDVQMPKLSGFEVMELLGERAPAVIFVTAHDEFAVQAFQIHQSLTEPQKFFFYEVFKDEAAFAEHQQSEHFKTLIAGQALPKLAKRERTQHRFV